MGKQWNQWQTFFLGSKITEDGDCNLEIKRCLLLGRKLMTNLDRILKSRDITLLTKVHLVQVFPIVMYRPEHWTIKKFSSLVQSCLTLCYPVDCSTPGFPVLDHLSEFAQTHVHRIGDAIQPSHSLLPPSPALNPSQHQDLFQWVVSPHQMA